MSGGEPCPAPSELDASIFQGRLIHILPGKRPPPPPEAAAGGEGDAAKAAGSYKEQKEAALKAGAGNRSAWNTLFMRADTVAEAVAAHFGEPQPQPVAEAPVALRQAQGWEPRGGVCPWRCAEKGATRLA